MRPVQGPQLDRRPPVMTVDRVAVTGGNRQSRPDRDRTAVAGCLVMTGRDRGRNRGPLRVPNQATQRVFWVSNGFVTGKSGRD
ncbi:hypothetical protein SISSUDRAFT_1056528 [Sistotremastrum suecicum HHB10207 ss-3]|uniref:Uncharacterized protein n=1 Tax=Sistotremastrum suecicum HHB10207 ss-3 TaxID=1314776 RepID=A0A165WP12_9AGAM|nr:hypothetical protein SISSUDRAFT_1056528 [Sistotremastrum suecicum HHB10207 ss-3]